MEPQETVRNVNPAENLHPPSDNTTRTRQATEKGREYTMEMKQKLLKEIYKRLTVKSSELNKLMADGATLAEVQTIYKNWMTDYEEFLKTHQELTLYMTPDERQEFLTGTYNEMNILLTNVKTSVQNWFALRTPKTEVEINSTIKASDSVSQAGGSQRSRSSGQSVISARLAEQTRQAELQAKSVALKKKQQLDLEEFQLKLKQEELVLETEMAVSDAKTKVLDIFEQLQLNENHPNSETGNKRPASDQPINRDLHFCNASQLNINNKPQVHSLPANYQPLNPMALSFTPYNEDYIPNQVNTDINRNPTVNNPYASKLPDNKPAASPYPSANDVLISVVQHLNRPPPELKPFGGDPLDYKRFIRQFNAKVVANTNTNNDKMSYLEQFTVGEPNLIVSGYSYLDAEYGYPAAMNELDKRYGNNDVLAAAFVKRALDWPPIKADNPKALDEYGIFLAECSHAVQNIDSLRVLEYPDNLKKLLGKLPFYFHDKWRNIIAKNREQCVQIKFSQFVNFVQSEARKANDPIFGKDALRSDIKDTVKIKPKSTYAKPKGTFGTNVTTRFEPPTPRLETHLKKRTAFSSPCSFCDKTDHALEECKKIYNLPYPERIDFLKNKGYCFGCLEFGHSRKGCRSKANCKYCEGRHPSICHVDGGPPRLFIPRNNNSTETIENAGKDNKHSKQSSKPASVSSTAEAVHSSDVKDTDCTMAIIPVAVKMNNRQNVVHTYAFMDPGSTATFCTENLLKQLGGTGRPLEITLDTMGQQCKLKTMAVSGLQICDLQLNNVIELPRVYTKDKMPVTGAHVPSNNDIKRWPHLKDINLPNVKGEIGLLIGNNVPDAYSPIEVRTGTRGSPHATRSLLGWICWNVVRGNDRNGLTSNTVLVNRADVIAVNDLEELNQIDRRIQDTLRMDFPEHIVDDRKEPSQNDRLFIEKVNKSLTLENGQYCISLPFKKDGVIFPDNKFQAQRRLKSLKTKLMSDSKYYLDYKTFMQTIIDKDYAEIVPVDELGRKDGRVWYIPHHGVYHPKKPDKIRVVFDCSATFEGACLNSELLQGPDLTTNLIAVLLRFRQERVAVIGDIESMFYRVNIPKNDADCLRFLWWEAGDIHQEPKTYRMKVHLFGAVSSPSCANVALNQTVIDNAFKFHSSITDMVNKQFYVDDFLASVESVEKAANLVKDVTELCALGGFRLTKWLSSSRDVIETIPVDYRAKDVQQLNLDCDSLPNERALGVHWITETDKLGFNIQPRDQPNTRRGVLSIVSSVFDPLGLAAPFVLIGKIILQDCCKRHIGWDEQLTGQNLKDWLKWLRELPLMSDIQIDRCYKANDLHDISSCELHVFADASEKGYGVAIYLRLTDSQHKTHVTLVMGKARVAPLKRISIPRLELTAACTAVRLSRIVTQELDLTVHHVVFWTDSMAVLRYINNERTRFHTFVANRIAVIRDGSEVDQWKYVPSKLNVADFASRGLHLDKFLENDTWFNGPKFLVQDEHEWPQQPTQELGLSEVDPEVKTTAATVVDSSSVIDDITARCSDWHRLKRVLAWVLVAVQQFKSLPLSKKNGNNLPECATEVTQQLKCSVLSEEQLKKAERTLVFHVQQMHFANEIDILTNADESRRGKGLPKSSSIRKLDPFIEDGLLRVGGRLSKADIPYETRHPIIIPRNQISSLYLKYIHEKVGHLGRNTVLNAARQTYWIIKAPSSIRKTVKECVACRRYQAQVGEQKMADLPPERLQSHRPPFTSVGVDFWGPIEVRRGRSVLKRYGVIFTCLATRAVHLELACSLNTDSCICAIRRLIARRGPVEVMRSDNGTNLVGSEREMREEIAKWNQTKIHNYLQQRGVKWIFNPPLASHHGGIWERMIRTVRKVLYSLLRQQSRHLDDELLCTLFCEVEAILNSRPITEVSQSYQDLDALTPNHLLLLKSGEKFPPGVFEKNDNYSNKRWRQVQYLADVFWRRWTLEYLPLLQERQKWLRPRRNLQKDDLVLVVDITPRKSWCLGRIIDTTRDRHGYVRSATVKTKATTLVRPVDKLCLILEADS